MSVENWSIQVARQTSELEKVKTSQFGLVPLCDELDRQDEFGELREDFLKFLTSIYKMVRLRYEKERNWENSNKMSRMPKGTFGFGFSIL